MTPQQFKEAVFSNLEDNGFQPASSLPLPEIESSLRPAEEVLSRLWALQVLFLWVATGENFAPSDALKAFADKNGLRDWMTPEEEEKFNLPRATANEQEKDSQSMGWKAENMWPLAWVLGLEEAPIIGATMIDNQVAQAIFGTFLPNLDANVEQMLQNCNLRDPVEVVSLEYQFYCVHNASRSAQLGGNTVPDGFDPVVHGKIVQERRHPLTWCLSPGVAWEDTDLGT